MVIIGWSFPNTPGFTVVVSLKPIVSNRLCACFALVNLYQYRKRLALGRRSVTETLMDRDRGFRWKFQKCVMEVHLQPDRKGFFSPLSLK